MKAKPGELQRYEDRERMAHWLTALLLLAAAVSGLAFFHPGLFFLSNFFGGGSWTRILHPFLGVATVAVFLFLYLRLRLANKFNEGDRAWRQKMGEMLRGNKAGMPAVGRYNAGQKMVFWAMSISLAVLLVTGVIFWRPWFAPYFSVNVLRGAVLIHSVAAVVMVLSVIVHVYASIWVQGTIRAMTRGTVSEAWAKKNHALWHREMTRGK
jgi:formate dehydrogenase subunit gamma